MRLNKIPLTSFRPFRPGENGNDDGGDNDYGDVSGMTTTVSSSVRVLNYLDGEMLWGLLAGVSVGCPTSLGFS